MKSKSVKTYTDPPLIGEYIIALEDKNYGKIIELPLEGNIFAKVKMISGRFKGLMINVSQRALYDDWENVIDTHYCKLLDSY